MSIATKRFWFKTKTPFVDIMNPMIAKTKFKRVISLLVVGVVLGTSFSQVALARSSSANATISQVVTVTGDKQTPDERLNALREKHQIRLTIQRERIITSKCRAAQNIVVSFGVRFDAVSAKRERIYTTINSRLDLIITRLKNLGVDVAKVRILKQTFEHQLADLRELFTNYSQILDDLGKQDCRQNPASFQAALIEARDLVMSIKILTNDFHKLIKTDLREILVRLVEAKAEVRSE